MTTAQEAARQYRKHGWATVPLRPNTKVLAAQGFTGRHEAEMTAQDWAAGYADAPNHPPGRGGWNIAVRLPSAHYFVCSRRRIGRKRRTDHATSCSHRQHPRHSKRGLQSHVSHDLSSILSCRACGSSALSLAPPSNLEQARTPHTRKMVEARDVHRHRRIRVNMTKGSNGYPPVWLIEARRVFAYRENRI